MCRRRRLCRRRSRIPYLVFFDFDKSNLTGEGKKIVDDAAAQCGDDEVTRIELTGHPTRLVPMPINLRLSKPAPTRLRPTGEEGRPGQRNRDLCQGKMRSAGTHGRPG